MRSKLTILSIIVAATLTTLSFAFGGKKEADKNIPSKGFEEPVGGFVSEKI